MKILHEVEYKNFTAKDVEKILKDTYTAARLEKQKVWIRLRNSSFKKCSVAPSIHDRIT